MLAFAEITTTSVDVNVDMTPFILLSLAVYVLYVVALWRVFSKAGYPGWLAIIPIVNMFVLVKVGGMSAWWGLLYFVPIANIVLVIIVALKVGRNFGHGAAFSIFLLWLFSIIGFCIIGFSSDTYSKVEA
ncbi:hypothetical protein GCM10009808_17480 [Microbacterium sediminicola]|uniref:Signal peptidase I n=1 Tax=Microbacterium sediminicola TaxID=415210 RepID=A0ABN2I8B0_9MICO